MFANRGCVDMVLAAIGISMVASLRVGAILNGLVSMGCLSSVSV